VSTTLKPLRHARFWLGLWCAAVLVVIVVCLIPPPPLALPQNSDKVEHLFAYFILAASAVQLFATRRVLCAVAAGLVVMGVGIEWAQGALTTTRMADPMDVLANTAGVVAGMLMMLTPLRDFLLRLQPR
jgi:VanZ family protein